MSFWIQNGRGGLEKIAAVVLFVVLGLRRNLVNDAKKLSEPFDVAEAKGKKNLVAEMIHRVIPKVAELFSVTSSRDDVLNRGSVGKRVEVGEQTLVIDQPDRTQVAHLTKKLRSNRRLEVVRLLRADKQIESRSTQVGSWFALTITRHANEVGNE
jgi:hypothetical protein